MADKDEQGTKQRIQAAAIELFARKGFGATGVREIAAEAGVSLAMVNYHFGSKAALLEEILTSFFERMSAMVEKNLSGDDSPEDKLRRHINFVVDVFRENPAMARVALVELPHDVPGLVELKAVRISQLAGMVVARMLPDLPEAVRANIRLEVLGPMLMGGVALHFMMRPVIEQAFGLHFDDEFYQGFADALVDVLMHGIYGLGRADAAEDGAGR